MTARYSLKRLAIFIALAFVVSCASWVLLVWLTEYGLHFSRTFGFPSIAVLCGVLAAAMKMWRMDQSILFNLLTAIICVVVPIVALPLVGITAFAISCYGLGNCDF